MPYTVNVVALGDSLTQGVGSTDNLGWREKLRLLSVAQGNPMFICGTTSTGTSPDPFHDGNAGSPISNNQTICVNRVQTYNPDAVFIECGTIDLTIPRTPAQISADIGTLIDTIANTAMKPWMQIVVFTILRRFDTANLISLYQQTNALLPAMIAARAYNATGNLALVDWNGGVPDSGYGGDALHLNDAGYTAMAPWMYQVGVSAALNRARSRRV